ncbi:MAG: hypothetical protein HUU37_01800, partial [Bdellovibrionales bacterium]|nr:hypothetical protein [Bdellovibrionales bacterium]
TSDFTPYLHTEYIQEKLAALELLRDCACPVAILHPSTVYGPGMQEEVLRGLRGRVKLVPPGGTSGVALGDFLRALDLVVEKRARGAWIVNGENFTFRDLFRWAARGSWCLRLPLPAFLEPVFQAIAQRRWGAGFAVHHSAFGFKYYSSGRIRHELGWAPQVSVANAIKEALDGGTPSR